MSLVNNAAVRKFVLAQAEERNKRGGTRFRRVGASVYPAVEACVRQFLINRVKAHPSRGVTIE